MRALLLAVSLAALLVAGVQSLSSASASAPNRELHEVEAPHVAEEPHAERQLAKRKEVNKQKKQNRLRRQIAKVEKAIAKLRKSEEQIGTPESERWHVRSRFRSTSASSTMSTRSSVSSGPCTAKIPASWRTSLSSLGSARSAGFMQESRCWKL